MEKEVGKAMSPILKEDLLVTITECTTKIQRIEDDIKELKQQLKDQRKEKIESQRRISDRRLTIYLAIAAIFGGFLIKILDWVATMFSQ